MMKNHICQSNVAFISRTELFKFRHDKTFEFFIYSSVAKLTCEHKL